ncbi:MAG TPA: hypothetical protein VFX19_04910 [Dehalococcoidia bacterium]|jgi:hypothetical protein|nr:hypothetical protein [Dehalococcoidia bacterium]
MANQVAVKKTSIEQALKDYKDEWFLMRVQTPDYRVPFLERVGEVLFHHPQRSRVESFSLKAIDAQPDEAHRLVLLGAGPVLTKGDEVRAALRTMELDEKGLPVGRRRW